MDFWVELFSAWPVNTLNPILPSMKNCLSLLALMITASFFSASIAFAQGPLHTPLKGIEVRLQSIPAEGKTDTLDADSIQSINFKLQTTTDDDGEFMFGYVPPGTYALGCSYAACNTAFQKAKRTQPESDSILSEEPVMRISINACEGVVCRVAVKKMTPNDWSSNPQPSTTATITKDWSNSMAWLNSGGGIILRVDGANSVISGNIVAQ